MATFELSGPDGGTYQVEAPSEFEALNAFRSTFDKPSQDSSLAGVGKSLAVGAAQGAIGLAGLPGDLYHLGLRALGDNLTPESRFGSNAIQKGVEQYTGDFYKPQGVVEETANKVGQFLPAMVGGPEAVGAKLLTRVAAPAVASEIGKEVAGPYGEIAGALAGAGGATMAARNLQATAAARRAVPTADNLLGTARGQFNQVHGSDLVINPPAVQQMARDLRTELLNDGYHPGISPGQAGVFNTIDRLENLGQVGGVTPRELEVIRKNLVASKTDADAATRTLARNATDSFMRRYSNLGNDPANVLNGDAQGTFNTLRDAIGNWAAGKRSNVVQGKAALGELNAATAGSGANEDNALRQAIKQLVRPVNNDIVPKAQRLGFNQAEIDAMNTVARGGPVGNTARYIGKLAPTGSVSAALGAGAGYGAAGPVGAVALPAVGYLAKRIGDMSTRNAVRALDFLVRSRSPLAQQVAAQLPPAVVSSLPRQSQILLGVAAASPALQMAPQPVPARSY